MTLFRYFYLQLNLTAILWFTLILRYSQRITSSTLFEVTYLISCEINHAGRWLLVNLVQVNPINEIIGDVRAERAQNRNFSHPG